MFQGEPDPTSVTRFHYPLHRDSDLLPVEDWRTFQQLVKTSYIDDDGKQSNLHVDLATSEVMKGFGPENMSSIPLRPLGGHGSCRKLNLVAWHLTI